MRRSSMLVCVCLLAALVGTPLRMAEAAADLERLAGEVTASGEIGEVDGGVGDEAEVGLQAADAPDGQAGVDCLLMILPPPADAIPDPFEVDCLRERAWWPEDSPARRHAWLQVLRF